MFDSYIYDVVRFYAGEEGLCWASYGTIADDVEADCGSRPTEKTVKSALRRLCISGKLIRAGTKNTAGKTTIIYRLLEVTKSNISTDKGVTNQPTNLPTN